MQAGFKQEDLFVKKGWLLRLGITKEWFKHWFVLRNNSLTYFRHSSAEDSGILDGVVDLGLIKSIKETDSKMHFAFCITMWDEKKLNLAALSSTLRADWIQAIKNSSNLRDQLSAYSVSDQLNSCNKNTESNVDDKSPDRTNTSQMSNVSKHFDSTNDENSIYYSMLDDVSNSLSNNSTSILPPSPPVNRTVISRVKDKAKSRPSTRSRITGSINKVNESSNRSIYDCFETSRTTSNGSGNSLVIHEYLPKGRFYGSTNFNNDVYDKQVNKQFPIRLSCNGTADKASEESFSHNNKVNGVDTVDSRERDDNHKVNNGFQNVQLKNVDDGYKAKYELLKNQYNKEKLEWEVKLMNAKLQSVEYNAVLADLQATLVKCKQQLSELTQKLESLPTYNTSLSSWSDILALCEQILVNGERTLNMKNPEGKINETYQSSETKQQLPLCNETSRSNKQTPAINNISATNRKEAGTNPTLPVVCGVTEKINRSETQYAARSKEQKLIQTLKTELSNAYANYDYLELAHNRLIKELETLQSVHESEFALLQHRINDLTCKLTSSERAARHAKQKLAKYEAKQERRRSSLKGKDSFTPPKTNANQANQVDETVTQGDHWKDVLETMSSRLQNPEKQAPPENDASQTL